MRPLPYPKKISPKEKLYYHYKIDPSCYALYDSALDTPIAYGSYNFVGAVLAGLPPTVTIFYYEVDNQMGWKMKKRYSPNKQTVDTADAKKTVDNAEEKKKDLT
jgi:hypothetical protein